MSQKHIAETAYGEIEYETVKCANCENMVRKENAIGVALDVSFNHGWMGELNMSKMDRGNLCPYCTDSIFGRDYSSRGGVTTGYIAILLEKLVSVDDPFFAIMAGCIGIVLGFMILVLVTGIIGVIV